jgi:hypothetical protein
MKQGCFRNNNGKRRFWQHATQTVWEHPGRFWIFPALSPQEWDWLRWRALIVSLTRKSSRA